jgi:hypothetical protein
MRHVTDGELHAYLDGALDLLPEGRGEEVRDHVSTCPACGERLQDEESIRQKAQALLNETAPPELEIPPFEELRARAEATDHSRGRERGVADPGTREETTNEGDRETEGGRPLWGFPMAWAATVILALGVGWMGGEIWRTLPPDDSSVFSGEPSGADPASLGRGDDTSEAGVSESFPTAAGAGRQEASEAPAALSVGGERAVEGRERLAEETSGGLVPDLAKASGELRDETPQPRAALQDLGAPAPDRSRVSPRIQSMESGTSDPEAPELLDLQEVDPDHSLALPGFQVLSVAWEEWLPGERALHIRQLLPMGDTLELRYVGMLMGTEPSASVEPEESPAARGGTVLIHPPFPRVMEASLPPGWNQVVMRKGRGWLVARAPLSVEHLRALLRSLR